MESTGNKSEDVGYNAAVERFRNDEYPMLQGSVYLDHAGTTPYSKSLMERFARDMTSNLFGNPHSASSSSQLSTSRIEDIRLRVLQFFNADPDEFDVVFVANATAGIKLVAEALRALPGGFDYLYYQSSHTSLVGVREEARNSICLDDRQVEEWLHGREPLSDPGDAGSRLFAYPAQSNMDGRRFPLRWADAARRTGASRGNRTYTLLDVAALVSSSPLDLSNAETAPDFVVLSFYKIFGFPDLGALLVRREAEDAFRSRKYFGGGTVDMVVCVKEQWHAPKSQFLHERLEDGTLGIHNIIALDAALDTHQQLFGSMIDVAAHTAFLSRRLHRGLQSLRHSNGQSVCTIYSRNPDESFDSSGPVVAFNIRNCLGAWISLSEVEKLANLKNFHIRTGGVCNPGGISSALQLEPWEMKRNFSSGFRCGTENEIIAGKPTGVIRASLGAMSIASDVDSFVDFIREFYADKQLPFDTQEPSSRPQNSTLHIHSISIYPIKSCGGFEVPAEIDWEVHPEGLAWDREWCLVHQGSGQVLSQKRYPRMSLIRPYLDFQRGELRVRYTGATPADTPREISIPLSQNPALFRSPDSSRLRSSRVCGEEIIAQAYASPRINGFFSAVLGVPCVLARFPAGGQGKSMRHAKAHLQKHQIASTNSITMPGAFPAPPSPPDSDSELAVERRILLSNESPILAISLASVDALNQEIKLNGGREVSPAVFRANVIISPGPSQPQAPYVEDSWTTLRIGEHDFRMLGACRRCHMVCINQETAEKSEEPFVTLSKTRRYEGKVFFGTHMCYSPGEGGLGHRQGSSTSHAAKSILRKLTSSAEKPTSRPSTSFIATVMSNFTPGSDNSAIDLPTHYLHHHRSQFRAALAAGTATPFVLPRSVAGSFVIPVLYLCIPHRKRPWLYRLRWAVVGLMVLLNWEVVRSGTGSENYAVGYAIGLTVAWGTIWGTALVAFMRVQWDVCRVQLRPRAKVEGETEEERKRRRKNAPDESVAAMVDDWEYYWEPFPEDGTLMERLGWVVSLYLSFRGAGHSRSTASPSFILTCLRPILISYILLDFWTLTARYDPYFVPGPSSPHPLPSLLSSLPTPLLSLLRSLFSLTGVLSALQLYLPLTQLLSRHNPVIPASQRALFLYSSTFGSPLSILTHGLTGFWSSFWHQSFRVGFTAPTTYLVHLGLLPRPKATTTKIAGAGTAFLLSGVMHALGGVTSLPKTTHFSGPIVFFLLQFVGILIQKVVGGVMGRYITVSKRWKGVGNVLFTCGWLHFTNGLLIEDMSHAAIWLFEPVPFSLLRMMGFGQPGEAWMRWDWTYVPQWYWGERWWKRGIRL
ncbi:pyridoxal phosphate-dependent transferase [Cercophora newfieldiana]|uniref:Molybdenum cofactor sulfurase n=1 Tax=Cercophora newfieldiana TaxID=92897 RepID=A0AA39YS69_9PEZI|nr:pyridoxal phosphate-dependent transferase [Cercophora newfieldiana]